MSGEIEKAVQALVKQKEEVLEKALKHFSINIEDEKDKERVKIFYVDDGHEEIWIDDQLIISFTPFRSELDGSITINYFEHYLKK